MSLPTQLHGLSEVKSALAVDPGGRVLVADPADAGTGNGAAALAAAARGLSVAGAAAKLGAITSILVKGAHSSTVTAVRPDAVLLLSVDSTTTKNQVAPARSD